MFHRIIERRHFWRHATLGEVAELYSSRVMRVIALHMATFFVSIYLYQNGFSLMFIALYNAAYYFFKVIIAYPSARYIARFGPKHGILLGNLLNIPALMVLTFVPQYGFYAVIIFALIQACAATVYDISYLVTFSKIKSSLHAGKEVSFMNIFENLGGGLSPLIGSVIATLSSPQAAMWVAAFLFAVSAWPLFKSAEPTRLRQKIGFSGFPWRMAWRSLRAEMGVGYDIVSSGVVWQLFLALIIFTPTMHNIYFLVGVISSVSILVSIVVSYIFGRLIDSHDGGLLIKYGVIAKAISHMARPFVGSPIIAGATDAVGTTATTAYSMPLTVGLFDTADRSGFRITYLFFIEMAANFGAALSCVVFAACLYLFQTPYESFTAYYLVSGLAILLIATHRFPIYQK